MIGYATIGSNDLERAKAFYDKVLVPLGGKRSMGGERMQGYGNGGQVMMMVCRPYDEQDAKPGNGNMLALFSPTRDAVDATYKAAIENGGADEGPPGLRGDTFYGAYFRDLDGNKICIFNMG